uniref:Uncharacterized protein n=1 Tax=Anguilla anguilla TaxID=7936 RepID=A0A0E9W987_ANGAN
MKTKTHENNEINKRFKAANHSEGGPSSFWLVLNRFYHGS